MSMKPKEIQELIDFISKSGLAEVNIETEGFKLSVRKMVETTSSPMVIAQSPVVVSNPVNTTQTVATQVQESKTPPPSSSQEVDESKLVAIKSPMIGTFYRSPNPDSPQFVSVGDEVRIGQVVCIIEAMKLFNEIESEVSGRIVKVLVENASPVEYDQPLFLVAPN